MTYRIKFSDIYKSDSEVTIEAILNTDKTVCVKVKDNGIGIESKYLPKIYDLFCKGTNVGGKGNGLGLYIVKKHCSNLDVNVNIDSVVGKSTTATVVIPIGEI